jgi:C4-dicarboxylate transporter DctM subunit
MISPGIDIALVFLVFIGLLGCGMAIPFAIGVPAALYLFIQGGLPALKGMGLVSYGAMASSALTAVPLFILMAEILQRGGVSPRVYRGLSTLCAPLPGGLLQTNIAGCAMFSAICGSSVATAATIGNVALPQLIARKYDGALSAGSLAAGGTLGILIPPSLVMIIYGAFTDTSVARLFMAGIVPGLILTALFMVYIGLHAKLVPGSVPAEPTPSSFAEVLRAFADLMPFAVLILLVFGSLYLGFATPTEAAAIGCALAVVINAIWGKLSVRLVIDALRETVRASGALLFIVFSAALFSYAITFAGVGEDLTRFVVGLELSRLELFFVVFVLYLVLGCFVEGLGMIVITVPLLHPVMQQYGVDPVFFGVMLVIFVELGLITPPVGINLFVIQSTWGGKLSEVVRGAIPFVFVIILLLGILVAWPELVMWLPDRMRPPV